MAAFAPRVGAHRARSESHGSNLMARTSGLSRRRAPRPPPRACGRASAGSRSRTCRLSSRCPRRRRRPAAARTERAASRRIRRPGSATSFCVPRPTVSGWESIAIALAGLERGARQHDEPRELAVRGSEQPGGRGLGGREDHRLLRQPQVACCRAHDPPDEEVQEHEKGELQDEERRLDLRRGDHDTRSREKVNSVPPIVKRVPSSSFSRLTRLPRDSTPFVESRSTSQYVAPSCRISAWRRETFGSATCRSASFERPRTTRRSVSSARPPFQRQHADLALDPELDGRGGLGRLRRPALIGV